MAEYIVTSRAEPDLAEILVYISNDDAGAAFAFERRLYDTFDLLAENPHDGRERPEFSEGTRSLFVEATPFFTDCGQAQLRLSASLMASGHYGTPGKQRIAVNEHWRYDNRLYA